MAALDVGLFSAASCDDSEENAGKELACKNGRSFAPGVICLCCMAGNCFVIGHITQNCNCVCLRKKGTDGGKRIEEARRFKCDYVRREERFRLKQSIAENCFHASAELMGRRAAHTIAPTGWPEPCVQAPTSCRMFVNDGKT